MISLFLCYLSGLFSTRFNVIFSIFKSQLISNFLLTYPTLFSQFFHIYSSRDLLLYFKHPQMSVDHALDSIINCNAPFLQSSLQPPHFLIPVLCFFPLTYVFFASLHKVRQISDPSTFFFHLLSPFFFLFNLYLLVHHYTSLLIFQIS